MHISIPYSIIIIKHIVILLVANVASVPLEYCKTQTKTNRYRPCFCVEDGYLLETILLEEIQSYAHDVVR